MDLLSPTPKSPGCLLKLPSPTLPGNQTCMPDRNTQFAELDNKYYTLPRSTRWATQSRTSMASAESGDQDACRNTVACGKYSVDENTPSPTALIYSRVERIPHKDFAAEVRANLDIELFIKEATLLLNLNCSTLDEILDAILNAVFTGTWNADTIGNNASEQGDPAGSLDVDMNDGPTTSHTNTITTVQAKTLNAFRKMQKIYSSAIDLPALFVEAKKSLLLDVEFEGDRYQRLAKTIKGISVLDEDGLSTDQSWVCALCSLGPINRRYLALARLSTPVNLGRSSEGTCLILLVITPTKEKETKSDVEVGRTFATILSDPEFRSSLMYAAGVEEVKALLLARANELANRRPEDRRRSSVFERSHKIASDLKNDVCFGKGLYQDLRNRLPHYWSDYSEGILGKNTLRKTISGTLFLYFACLLPTIAFGVLNFANTNGQIDVTQMIISQTIGGLCNGFFGGQPLIVLLSTAPLALYTKIVYTICESFGLNFTAMYGCVGLFNSLFLFGFSVTGLSSLMRWSTRSTEEIFALFVSVAFIMGAVKDCYKTFQKYYVCQTPTQIMEANQTIAGNRTIKNIIGFTGNSAEHLDENLSKEAGFLLESSSCNKEVALLYLLLLLGTVWLSLYLYNFTKTPFLTAGKREILTDFALPIAVLVMSTIGSLLSGNISLEPYLHSPRDLQLSLTPLTNLDWRAVLGALGLALPLSMLFYMEQNIASAIVNSPANRLRKSPAPHWDLMVVALINMVLSLFCLPWVHAALPHSPLHIRALADIEERIDMGQHIRQTIVRVRETRLTTIISHIFIGLSLLMIPIPLCYIPPAVLMGLFVYMAVTAVYSNQLFERLLLFITEQSAYPPSHYIRRVPQRKLHLFTIIQLIQLLVLCAFGFAPNPYVEMVFPVLLVGQIVFRHKLIPKLIDRKYLDALDRPF
ncbi:sodium bicarbonate transporter-like protein 11 [Clonorchis sinensis]|uniref:Sodium bicarbonate transporter-like protein 11 n=2 Tax=Clonorchis sinensis TaxID=79923 RepID=G7YII3_CLOSI|nr:sodium bicarbonate transporter-like protein 11 [Clonorchis sinensis]